MTEGSADVASNAADANAADVEVLERESRYQGFFEVQRLRLRHRLFAGGWSRPLTRELFVRGPAVGVLLYDPRHRLVGLVEQFRVGALAEPGGPWVLEVAAGMVEAGEDARAVARRETIEETGIAELILEPMCRYLTSPGGSNETHELFCGLTDLRGREGCFGLHEEHEDIRLVVMPEAAALAGLTAGRYNNAATIIALQWLALHGVRVRGTLGGDTRNQSTDSTAEY